MSCCGEPSYLAFARANARDGVATSATVVRELVARIDRDAAALAEAKPTPEQVAAVVAMERIRAAMDSFFKGETSQFDALGKIAEHLGAYEIERI